MSDDDQYLSEHCDHPVVVGVDGSDSAMCAVRWAAREADLRRAPLRLVHVCVLPSVRRPRPVPPPRSFVSAVLAEGRYWLTKAVGIARHAVPGLLVTTDLRAGVVADVLLAESRTAQLVVLGSRGQDGFRRMVGSVVPTLIAHGRCSVVAVRPATRRCVLPETGPVVVGVDCPESSDTALSFAFEEAAAHGVPLAATHTWLDLTMAGARVVLPGAVDWAGVQREAERWLDERLTAWRDKYPQVEVRAVVRRGRPERVLLEQARVARLVVVGAHGGGAFAHTGAVSMNQALLHHAGCPVAVARPARM